MTRINKRMADLGLASRREADALIEAGKVRVNGVRAIVGQQVADTDAIEVSGAPTQKRYLAYYKARGVITHSPAEGETDIAAQLAKVYGVTDVAPIGRLDKDSEGLIILSNDGRITGRLLDPAAAHEKEYEVTVDKRITGPFLKALSGGIDIEGYRTKPATAVTRGENRFVITLTEGKKHQIRRMCAAMGYQVKALKRVRIMNVALGKLKPNQYRELKGAELKAFLNQLGL
jgi:23S rRNA pseudouridine2604 synthase